MAQLKRNKYGQFDDTRAAEIHSDFIKAIIPVAERWKGVDSFDIENIMFHAIPYFMAKRTLRMGQEKIEREELLSGNNVE